MKPRRNTKKVRENYSTMTQSTVPGYVIVILLLGDMTLFHMLPQVASSYREALSSAAPCIHEGHLKTDRNWFGYLANITIIGSGRLTFEFIYPVDRCCQNVLFYRQDQLAIMGARMNCWNKEYILRPEDDQMLRLTPSFSWSGCHTATADTAAGRGGHGRPTEVYVCKGGRSFAVDESVRAATTWYVAVSNCATLHGLNLYYFMEVHGQVGECRPMSPSEMEPPTSTERSAPPTDWFPPPPPTPYLREPASTPAKAGLTPREASLVKDIVMFGEGGGDRDEEEEDVCLIEGDVNTTKNWFGFIANLTLARDGWFGFAFTYPYKMQTQNVVLYERDELFNLHWDQTCFEKELVVRQQLVPEKILDLSFRSTWHGCVAQKVLYSEDPVNITCTGEKRFDTHDHWSSALTGNDVRRVYLAVSNCRSNTGLLLHYRLTVHGNVDSTPCSNSATPRSLPYFAVLPLLVLLLTL